MCTTTENKAADKKAAAAQVAADRAAELCRVLQCRPQYVLARLKAIGLAATCGRCGGSGNYSYCQMYGSTCFGCNGRGVKLPKVTVKLIDAARDAVAAGKLQPYLENAKATAAAKVAGDALLDDYAALTNDEKAAVAAAGITSKFWAIGTARGFVQRAAASPFYTAAQNAFMAARHEKNTDEKARQMSLAIALRNAMVNESPAIVPAAIDGATVIDIFKLSETETAALHAAEQAAREVACRRLLEIKAAAKS